MNRDGAEGQRRSIKIWFILNKSNFQQAKLKAIAEFTINVQLKN